MLLADTWLDGARVDLRIEGERIAAIGALTPREGEAVLRGGLACPHFAEPHVHLDATQLGARVPNVSGTLREGIANWAALRETLTAEDVRARALETVRWYVRRGTTRIRTHVDTACLPAAEALLALREELKAGLPGEPTGMPVTLQVVAFPQEGILRAAGREDRWRQVVAMGCDAVGAIPHFERTADEGWRSVRLAFDLAAAHGLRLDLHCDETDDPGSRNLEVVCAEAIDRGFQGRVVCGHCTALHSYPNPHAAKVIELVAEAGVQVVANPLDNVVLQGRYDHYPRRRGLTRVDQLWAAGALVGIGHDSVVDPWYRLGRADLLDAASMLVHLGHLTGEAELRRAFATLHRENHLPFGAPPALTEGGPADLLWFEASDPIEALRLREPPRVFYRGAEVRP
jgi:cytosine deaminase